VNFYRLLLFVSFALCLEASDAPLRSDSRLLDAQSPYLRQHADNLVDWYPWGEAAFERARAEAKPIFLSIGYSTCHWCHVMERESFMDATTADILNQDYICIKVDREERPDIDRIYMNFVQASTGSGGWPMSVWLTPDLKPFFGGTYFSPESQYGRPGFKSLLTQIADSWAKESGQIEAMAEEIHEGLKAQLKTELGASLDISADMLSQGASTFARQFDSGYGGFGRAPKFPRPSVLHFLHRVALREGLESDAGQEILAMSTQSLRAMAAGGIYDHLGGGFHRYSVDRTWHVPHFEKMLYDQSQLVTAYLEAYQLTGDAFFAGVARGILHYVSRDMTAPGGGFYSAEDADSLVSAESTEHSEGAFYIWAQAEIEALLGGDAALFHYVYGVESDGNVTSDPHQEFTSKNILKQQHSVAEAAVKFKQSEARITEALESARQRLLEARSQRPRPNLDDKILTAWNGLMISAYARAYNALGDPEYLEAATRAAVFLKTNLVEPESQTLLRSFREKPSGIEAFTIDYACLIQGLLDLYEAGFDSQWLQWAESLQQKQDALFWDETDGGYFASSANDPSVIIRMEAYTDGALPSDNSVAARNLLRLSAMLNKPQWSEQADQILRAASGQSVGAIPQMLAALDFALQKPQQIVIAGSSDSPDTQTLRGIINQRFHPHRIVLLADGAEGQAFLAKHEEAYEAMQAIEGKATAYICEDFTCERPSNDPEVIQELLR